MLSTQNSRCQSIHIISRKNWNGGLADDRALIYALGNKMHASAMFGHPSLQSPLMGMQSFDKTGVPVREGDVSVAKNYLNEDEIKLLGLLVEQYLAFAEVMAQQRTPMYMKDWIQRLDSIIQLNGRELLTHAGKISHQTALEKSAQEYDKYREAEKQPQQEESLRELERDIKQLFKKE